MYQGRQQLLGQQRQFATRIPLLPTRQLVGLDQNMLGPEGERMQDKRRREANEQGLLKVL